MSPELKNYFKWGGGGGRGRAKDFLDYSKKNKIPYSHIFKFGAFL
jgi:hypothetical protein